MFPNLWLRKTSGIFERQLLPLNVRKTCLRSKFRSSCGPVVQEATGTGWRCDTLRMCIRGLAEDKRRKTAGSSEQTARPPIAWDHLPKQNSWSLLTNYTSVITHTLCSLSQHSGYIASSCFHGLRLLVGFFVTEIYYQNKCIIGKLLLDFFCYLI